MINLDDIRGHGALSLLENYEGKNPYLKRLKLDYLKNKKLQLTDAQAKYIIENHKVEPLFVNRVIAITPFLGEELKNKHGISFVPEKILIEYILANTEKTFHVYGKLKKNQAKSEMYWLPKTQVLDDPYFESIDVDVDFEKYEKIDSFILKDGTIGRKLYDHQKSGIKFLLSREGCILGDDMGLGKCLMSVIAALEKGVNDILIVCPSAVKINWEREINYFQCFDTAIIEGRKWEKAKFTIINYDILKNFHTIGDGKKKKGDDHIIEFNRELVNSKFDLVIIDEAHNLKNKNSIRGEIMTDLCVKHGIKTVWLLTGTPVANRPMDYFNLLKLIKAPIADNWKFFAQRYCEGKRFYKTLKNGKRKQIWLTNGASNLEELSLKTKNILLRRLKKDVLDMPDKVISQVYHKLSKRGIDEYEKLWDDYIEKRKKEGKKGTLDKNLVEIILLRKFIAMEAIPHTIEMTEDAIEQEKKIIIFTNFTDELLELADHFGNKCVIHYGEMNDTQKQESVDRFQQDPNVKVFIGNIRSAGVGITLTQGTVVIFNSFEWVPGLNDQAEDRAYRLGQNENVNVYYQLFEDTISVKMWEILLKKKDIIATIIGEKEMDDEEIITIMMENLIEEFYG